MGNQQPRDAEWGWGERKARQTRSFSFHLGQGSSATAVYIQPGFRSYALRQRHAPTHQAPHTGDEGDLATHQGDTRHEGSPRSRLLSLGRGGGHYVIRGWKGGNGFVRLGRQHIFSFATRAYPRHCSKSVMCLSSGLRSINGRGARGVGQTGGARPQHSFLSIFE